MPVSQISDVMLFANLGGGRSAFDYTTQHGVWGGGLPKVIGTNHGASFFHAGDGDFRLVPRFFLVFLPKLLCQNFKDPPPHPAVKLSECQNGIIK